MTINIIDYTEGALISFNIAVLIGVFIKARNSVSKEEVEKIVDSKIANSIKILELKIDSLSKELQGFTQLIMKKAHIAFDD